MNALGIYLIISLFFVLATLVEFAVVLVLARFCPQYGDKENAKINESEKTNTRGFKKKSWAVSSQTNIQDAESNEIIKKKNIQHSTCSLTEKMDFMALLIFMFIYFLFNCVYFMHYM